MAVRGNAKAVSLGPGSLRLATLGTAGPVDLTTAWGTPWSPPFYTEDGSSFSYETSFDDVSVAEELDPIDSAPTGRSITVEFSMAEVTAENLKRAMNGGTVVTGTGFSTFTPPELGDETYTAIGFESEDGLERWVWNQSKQTGTVQMERRKGATKTLIACSFKVYKPAAGGPPFTTIIGDARKPVVVP